MTRTRHGADSRGPVLDVVEPVLAAAGVDLEDLQVTSVGRRRLLRVVVDRDDGVSLDDVAALSQAVSARLDEADAMGGAPYVLEVTSPGVDRPLLAPRHWRRATGRLVRVALAAGGELTGRVVDCDEAGVTVDTGSPQRLDYGEIARAHVQVEFRRPAGEGESRREGR